MCEVYGEDVVSESDVRLWCLMFKDGRTNIHMKTKVTEQALSVTNRLKNQCQNPRKFLLYDNRALAGVQISRTSSLLNEVKTN